MMEPAEVFCLAEFLAEEMQARGWTSDDVAKRMQNERDWRLNSAALDVMLAVQDERMLISDETFSDLSQAFGISEQYFRNLHDMWLRWPDRRVPFECPDDVFGGAVEWVDKDQS